MRLIHLLAGSLLPVFSLADPIYIWPLPTQVTKGDGLFLVDNGLKFHSAPIETLSLAWKRYYPIIFPHTISTSDELSKDDVIKSVRIIVDDPSEAHPQLSTDESYTLSIQDPEVLISAPTIYGAMHALETLSQLIIYNFDEDCYQIDGTYEIYDVPRFPHRGLLLDTSRHFHPIPDIKRSIDGLAYSKMNVFHWHVVDTQAFPYQSSALPDLWHGAYTNQERYSQNDMKEVVEYARQRGVRVMLEFDVPGHAASWCVGEPSICPDPITCQQPLDPSSDRTFEVITTLLDEATTIFPELMFHLGGDEVNTDCWESDPEITAWMLDNNMTSNDAYKYFVSRAADIALSVNRQPVQWVEVYENFGEELNKATIVHVWKGKDTLADVVASGYRALLSDEDLWYLDHTSVTWDQVYNNEPFEEIDNEDQQALVLGGQVQMWSEKVDESDLDNTVWPRAAAFAERVWSSKDVTIDSSYALDRIEYFRCLLNARGIGAAPVNNAVARSNPPSPGSCYDQRR